MYESSGKAKRMFLRINRLLGRDFTDVMFSGSVEDLQRTVNSQLSVFITGTVQGTLTTAVPDGCGGHSVGEFTALVASGALDLETGLRLVSSRAEFMNEACEGVDASMAAVMGLEDEEVERICKQVEGYVVCANYNSPGQVVVSGTAEGVGQLTEQVRILGRGKIIPIKVSGAFHTRLMSVPGEKLRKLIEETPFRRPQCVLFQNLDGQGSQDPGLIKSKLQEQMTSPVLWKETLKAMFRWGARTYFPFGPGRVMEGLAKKNIADCELLAP